MLKKERPKNPTQKHDKTNREINLTVTLEQLKKESDVRIKKNRIIQLEMRIGWEKTLYTFLTVSTFHMFIFIAMASNLWLRIALIAVYIGTLLTYRSLNHFHILDLNKRELQLHKGFIKQKEITPILRFDQLLGFGVQTYWTQKKGNSVERIAIVAYAKDGGIIRLSDQSWWILWNPFANGFPDYNRRAKLLAAITDTEHIPGRNGCRVFISRDKNGEPALEHHLIPPNGSMGFLDRLQSRYYRDWENDPQTNLDATLLPPLEDMNPELINMALRAERVEFRKPKQFLNPGAHGWFKYVEQLKAHETLWAKFDKLEEDFHLRLNMTVRFDSNERTAKVLSYESKRLETLSNNSKTKTNKTLAMASNKTTDADQPSKNATLSIKGETIDTERWIDYLRLERRYRRELGHIKSFTIEEIIAGNLNTDQAEFERQIVIYRSLFLQIWRAGPWSRTLLRYPLNEGTYHQFQEDMEFNLEWKARFDQMLFQAPARVSKEVQPPPMPFTIEEINAFRQQMEPHIKAKKWAFFFHDLEWILGPSFALFAILMWLLMFGSD